MGFNMRGQQRRTKSRRLCNNLTLKQSTVGLTVNMGDLSINDYTKKNKLSKCCFGLFKKYTEL